MENTIIDSLKTIDSQFSTNELAYLALTSKIENPIRNRWAFNLHSKLSNEFVVAREWRRTDMAILNASIPKALFELKAMYTFDAALDQDGISGFINKMEADEKKAKSLSEPSTDIYLVLFATHPTSIVPIALNGVVKYRQDINRAIHTFGSGEKVKNVAFDAVERKLHNRRLIAKGILQGGYAFKINTEVLFWVIKA